MIFHQTELEDAVLIELDELADDRGFFARTFCAREFEKHGIAMRIAQTNLSYNKSKHTLRGMHYQASPYEEAKLVRCIKGAIYDVIIDLRPESPTYTKWSGFYLNEENRHMLYVPEGFAHGFLTLDDDSEVSYLMSEFYQQGAGRGIRWDDPYYNIDWPATVEVISEKDKQWPQFTTSAVE